MAWLHGHVDGQEKRGLLKNACAGAARQKSLWEFKSQHVNAHHRNPLPGSGDWDQADLWVRSHEVTNRVQDTWLQQCRDGLNPDIFLWHCQAPNANKNCSVNERDKDCSWL